MIFKDLEVGDVFKLTYLTRVYKNGKEEGDMEVTVVYKKMDDTHYSSLLNTQKYEIALDTEVDYIETWKR